MRDRPSTMKDVTGERFGMLVAIKPEFKKRNAYYWSLQCDCGAITFKCPTLIRDDIRHGRVPNCGCFTKIRLSSLAQTHGMRSHRAYRIWMDMKSRCLRPNNHNFKYYGGRGIKIAPTWLESFEAFWADMGPTYKDGLQLDRVDTNGDYAPGNARWVTPKENSRNKRNNRVIDTPWGPITIAEAAEKSGLSFGIIWQRLDRGWGAHAALSTPAWATPTRPTEEDL